MPDEVDPGEFIWTIDAVDHSVTLTEAAAQGTFLQSTGNLKPIKVTDSRANGPTWTISGQLSDFTGGLSGKYLGWTPNVSVAGSGATPGGQVLSGFTSGNGLKDASILGRPRRVTSSVHRHHRRRSRPAPPEGHGRRHLLGDPDHHGPVMTQPTPQPRFTRSAQLMSKHPQRGWRRRATALVAPR